MGVWARKGKRNGLQRKTGGCILSLCEGPMADLQIKGLLIMVRTLLAGLLVFFGAPAAAMAADAGTAPEPTMIYAIDKVCSDGRYDCTTRMVYAPGQKAMVVRPGSHWYQTASRNGVQVGRR